MIILIMLNRDWHLKNKMPENPTLEQRIEWHRGHAKNCDCRKAPENLKKYLDK